jgi:hypothetical protein
MNSNGESLEDAKFILARTYPGEGASVLALLRWAKQCEQLYGEVLKTDPEHEREARRLIKVAREEMEILGAMLSGLRNGIQND